MEATKDEIDTLKKVIQRLILIIGDDMVCNSSTNELIDKANDILSNAIYIKEDGHNLTSKGI